MQQYVNMLFAWGIDKISTGSRTLHIIFNMCVRIYICRYVDVVSTQARKDGLDVKMLPTSNESDNTHSVNQSNHALSKLGITIHISCERVLHLHIYIGVCVCVCASPLFSYCSKTVLHFLVCHMNLFIFLHAHHVVIHYFVAYFKAHSFERDISPTPVRESFNYYN